MPAKKIRFLPNDPLASTDHPERHRVPLPDRGAGRAIFKYQFPVDPGIYATGTPGFLYWQCRDAALTAIETWEFLDGPLLSWVDGRSRLTLHQNRGTGLNAFYDRASLAFYNQTTGSKTTYTGASADLVAHEVGHAILDGLRPDLWNSGFFEISSFHEAFGDCLSLLTALQDRRTRSELLDGLDRTNYVERIGEDLADGIKRVIPLLPPASRLKLANAARPRRMLNRHQWQLPTTLPDVAAAGQLDREPHIFGQVFTGCFYDTIRNLLESSGRHTQRALLAATNTAGKLLAAAVRSAPHDARFFQSVGRAMIQADDSQNDGAHHLEIRDAFTAHGVALGTAAMLAPTAGLGGRPPDVAAARASAVLSRTARQGLLERIQAPKGSRLRMNIIRIGNRALAAASHARAITLTGLDDGLRGVLAHGVETILLGQTGGKAAALGSLPNGQVTAEEVRFFVKDLVDRNLLGLRRDGGGVLEALNSLYPTHRVRVQGRRKTLDRVRFACGAMRASLPEE